MLMPPRSMQDASPPSHRPTLSPSIQSRSLESKVKKNERGKMFKLIPVGIEKGEDYHPTV